MNHNQISTFVALARTGSFSQTAAALFLTQPSVTQRIASLEKELGVKLFERKRGSAVRITEAGARLLPHAQRLLHLFQEARAAISCPTPAFLNLGIAHSLSNTLIPELVEAFKKDRPDLLFNIKLNKTEQILDLLQQGQIEVALVRGNARTLAGYKPFVKKQIASDRVVAFGAAGSALAKRSRVSAADLAGEPIIAYTQDSDFWRSILAYFGQAGVTPRVVAETDDLELIKKLASFGLGISFLAESYIREDVWSGRLALVELIDAKDLERSPFLVYRQQPDMKPVLAEFVSFVEGHCPRT